MRTDLPSPPRLRAFGMFVRSTWTVVLLACLTRCEITVDQDAECLKLNPNDPRCCAQGKHIDHGTCCPDGEHAVTDVQHPEWGACIPDEDAGIAAKADASADAP